MNTRRGLLIYAALCLYVGAMALATAYTWLHITHRHTLTVGSVIACTVIAVTSSLLLEQAVKQVRRRGQPRRTHARGRRQARVHDLQTSTSTPKARTEA